VRLLEQDVYLVANILATVLGETAALRKIRILPGLGQTAPGKLAQIFADHIKDGLLQRCQLFDR
jgi:hypothetical protein